MEACHLEFLGVLLILRRSWSLGVERGLFDEDLIRDRDPFGVRERDLGPGYLLGEKKGILLTLKTQEIR